MLTDDELQQLYRYAYALSRDSDRAKDLVQESFLKLLKASQSKKLEEPLAYSIRCLRNFFVDERKREERVQQMNSTLQDTAASYELDDILIDKMQVEQVLDCCTASEREILFLWAQQGMSYSEIADKLEISRNILLGRIHRLRQRLQRELGVDA